MSPSQILEPAQSDRRLTHRYALNRHHQCAIFIWRGKGLATISRKDRARMGDDLQTAKVTGKMKIRAGGGDDIGNGNYGSRYLPAFIIGRINQIEIG